MSDLKQVDLDRIERKLDMIISLLMKIVPVDLSKQERWRQEAEDLKAGRRKRARYSHNPY
jgi:hypothetical protein